MDSKIDAIVSIALGNRGTVYDANGIVVEVCIEANLITGRCVVWETRDGKKFIGAKKLVVDHPAPLRFDEWI